MIICLSNAGVALLGVLGMPKALDSLSKIVIDTVLYLVSYRVQNKWVFAPDKESK